MERRYYKAINFDLDTYQLQEYYPGSNYRLAYKDLCRFFAYQKFSHRQGSGYTSDVKMTSADIYDLLDDLRQELPWINNCVRRMDATNIGRQYDLAELLQTIEETLPDDLR